METLEKDTGQRKLPTILLVEDDDDLRSLMADALERVGYEVNQASDGSVALELLKLAPDKQCFLVTDIKMPKMNGDALIAESMRQGLEFVSIIVATGEEYVGMGIV